MSDQRVAIDVMETAGTDLPLLDTLPGRKVTKSIPSYLRIHREVESIAAETSTLTRGAENAFWDAFSSAIGWRIDPSCNAEDGTVELLPAVHAETLDSDQQVAVGKSAATQLAHSALQLCGELQQNRQAMRRLHSESTLRAALLGSDTVRDQVANGVEATLADAAAACRCDAVIVYTLDEHTEYLHARFQHGLAPKVLDQPPRMLKECRGDLEAMVQGVIAIDDLNAGPIDTWNCPFPFAAGICVVIQSDGVPTGTLWLLSHEPTEFGTAETAAARMAASCLALQWSTASQPTHQDDASGPVQEISTWQFESLPIGAAIADDWLVDGMIESPRPWATGWHNWDVLPDGSLMLAIAEAVDSSAKGAMHAAIARAAVAAHTGYRHSPAQMIQRVSDTLWQTSTGEQLVSLLYARIDPETGEGEVASAGSIAALIGNRYGFRPLVDGHGQPLNTHVDARFVAETFRVTEGETLLAYTAGMLRDGACQRMLGEQIRTCMQDGDTHPLAQIRRQLTGLSLHSERGALTLVRG